MIFDLSHPIAVGMPVYPGTPAPGLTPLATLERDGFLEHRLSLTTHTGTHIDLPAHLLPGGATQSDLALDRFLGPALLLDLRGDLRGAPRGDITPDHLAPFLPRLAEREFALLLTGWGERWGTPGYLEGWPTLTREAAELLALFPLKGVGVDTPSFDPAGAPEDSPGLPVHRLLLGKGMVLVENLANLPRLPHPEFTFLCLPLPLTGAEGSPVRAAALA